MTEEVDEYQVMQDEYLAEMAEANARDEADEPGTQPTLNDEALELIDRLLSGYEIALENILYKNRDITEDVQDINRARLAIDFALHGYKTA